MDLNSKSMEMFCSLCKNFMVNLYRSYCAVPVEALVAFEGIKEVSFSLEFFDGLFKTVCCLFRF